MSKLKIVTNTFSISRGGYSIVISIGEGKSPKASVIANLSNFIEIMEDGSAKLRILLTNDGENDYVNITSIFNVCGIFKKIYRKIFKDFGNIYINAYKYEKLTVLKQFFPIIVFDEKEDKFANDFYFNHKINYGDNRIITSDRIPKSGMRVIDKRYFNRFEIEYNIDNIVNELFCCEFAFL